MDGTLAYTESTDSKDGKVLRYEWKHLQMESSGVVDVRDGKVHYLFVKGGSSEKSTRDAPENIVFGPTVILYVQTHWKKLMADSDIAVRIGVPDRMDDYGFQFIKMGKRSEGASEVIHVELKPSSFFVSLAVNPISFVFSSDGAGRTHSGNDF